MGELRLDISRQVSKTLDRYLDQQFDFVITVCSPANEARPVVVGAKYRGGECSGEVSVDLATDHGARIVRTQPSYRSTARSPMGLRGPTSDTDRLALDGQPNRTPIRGILVRGAVGV